MSTDWPNFRTVNIVKQSLFFSEVLYWKSRFQLPSCVRFTGYKSSFYTYKYLREKNAFLFWWFKDCWERARTTMGYGVGTKSITSPKEGTKIFSRRVVLKIYKLNFELMYFTFYLVIVFCLFKGTFFWKWLNFKSLLFCVALERYTWQKFLNSCHTCVCALGVGLS